MVEDVLTLVHAHVHVHAQTLTPFRFARIASMNTLFALIAAAHVPDTQAAHALLPLPLPLAPATPLTPAIAIVMIALAVTPAPAHAHAPAQVPPPDVTVKMVLEIGAATVATADTTAAPAAVKNINNAISLPTEVMLRLKLHPFSLTAKTKTDMVYPTKMLFLVSTMLITEGVI